MDPIPTRRIAATEFKNRSLGLLKEVAETGEPLTVTSHGHPIVHIIPTNEKPLGILGCAPEWRGLMDDPEYSPYSEEEWAQFAADRTTAV